MGTWGAGIFADDVACDVRDAYRDLIGQGLNGANATTQLLRDFKGEINDYDDGPIFWLALAATQSNLGRLEKRVKTKAVALIDSSTALRRWSERANGQNTKQRQRELAKLRAKLLARQPSESKVRKPRKEFVDTFEWPIGQVFSYRLQSGKRALFLVADRQNFGKAGFQTLFALLDWNGKRIPPFETVKKIRLCLSADPLDEKHAYLLAISRQSESEPSQERIDWLNVRRSPKKEKLLRPVFRGTHIDGGYGIATWEVQKSLPTIHIDARLEREFGWK